MGNVSVKPIYVVAIIRRGGFLRNIPQQNWVPRTFGMKKKNGKNGIVLFCLKVIFACVTVHTYTHTSKKKLKL
jgi:hypothetical protein